MQTTTPKKVNYKKPPVIELVLSAQFARIEQFNSCHFGGLQKLYAAEGYTAIEEQPPLQSTFETFHIEAASGIPVEWTMVTDFAPRIWFKTPDNAFVIQVQPNRLVCNWRKTSANTEYPRYEALLSRFQKAYDILGRYVADLGLRKTTVNQCEVSYINHVIEGDRQKSWSEPHRYFKIANPFPVSPGQTVEDNNFQIRYVLNPWGPPTARLYIIGQPLIGLDQRPIFGLTLTVKGVPQSNDLEGAVQFFNFGNQTIVQRFDELVTEHAAALWERTS